MQRKVVSLATIVICTALIAVSLFAWFYIQNGAKKGGNAVVYIASQKAMTLKLDKNETYQVENTGIVIEIENGSAYIKKSDCKCKTCTRFGKISAVGESAVCLPNKVTLVIEGEGDIDAQL